MKKIEQFKETERKLMDSYEKLLENGSKISVDTICEEANLHHQTFYRHFKNKEEFFVYYINKTIENFINENDKLPIENFCVALLERTYNKPKLMMAYINDAKTRQIIVNKICYYLGVKLAKEYEIEKKEEIFFYIGGLLYFIIQCLMHHDMIDIENAKNTLRNIFIKIRVAIKS